MKSSRWAMRCWGLLLSCVALSAGGCAIIHQMIAGDGPMVDPQFDGLAGKKVAVVCVVNSGSYGMESVAEPIAQQVGLYLRQHVEGIRLVRSSEVADWIDNNSWDQGDFVEVGRGVDADMVVAIEIESFRLYDGQTMFKGQTSLSVRVIDVKDDHVVFQAPIADFAFPRGHGISTTDRSEASFRRIFIQQLGNHIARMFYKHPLAEEFAIDAASYAH